MRPSFASLLRKFRLAHGLTQEALAEAAGLSRDAISLLERGARRSPRRDTVALLAQALRLSGDEQACLQAAASEWRMAAAPTAQQRSNCLPALPLRLTSFIGRESEIAEVRELMLAKRLLTLTGTGGIGKTSLALEVAAAARARFADGVALAELAAVTDEGLVPQAIAAAVGVREQPGEPIFTTLNKALRTTQGLLVVDNCEHLVEACAHLVEALLQSCPRMHILATSREPLRIGPEFIWRVPALAVPEHDNQPLTELATSAAIRLFVERAAAVRPGFALTAANASAVAEVCRRLDGIPLAIELAAARTEALTPEQIARHLNDRFRVLTAGSRTALPRHQTLRALFDWSHDLLSEKEKVLFRRLAVFGGGWTLEAAEAVCGQGGIGRQEFGVGQSSAGEEMPIPDTGYRIPIDGVLDVLIRLIDKSLVLVEERGGEARYRMLETLRQYAQEKLNESGETRSAQAAHAAYFALLVGGLGPQPVQEVVERLAALPLESVAGEVDNLRTALRYFLNKEDAESGLRVAARIYHLWMLRGPREEGREWLLRFLAMPAPAPALSRTAALFAAGWLATWQGDLAEAHASFAEAATLAQSRGDRLGWAHSQIQLALVASLSGEPARARAELESGARLARVLGAPEVLLESLVELGYLAVAQGDLAGARRALAEGRAVLPRFPAVGFRFHWLAGDLALADGQGDRATREYHAALADRWTAGDSVGVAISALGLAEVAVSAHEGARAARLLGGYEGIALRVGGQPIAQPVQQARVARVEATAREQIGAETFAALRAEGVRLRLEEVVQVALGEEVQAACASGGPYSFLPKWTGTFEIC